MMFFKKKGKIVIATGAGHLQLLCIYIPAGKGVGDEIQCNPVN